MNESLAHERIEVSSAWQQSACHKLLKLICPKSKPVQDTLLAQHSLKFQKPRVLTSFQWSGSDWLFQSNPKHVHSNTRDSNEEKWKSKAFWFYGKVWGWKTHHKKEGTFGHLSTYQKFPESCRKTIGKACKVVCAASIACMSSFYQKLTLAFKILTAARRTLRAWSCWLNFTLNLNLTPATNSRI